MDQAPGPAGMHGGVWATDVRASRGVDTFLPGASKSAVASSPTRWRYAAVRNDPATWWGTRRYGR